VNILYKTFLLGLSSLSLASSVTYAQATPPTFAGQLSGSSATINIAAAKDSTITVYQFDPAYKLKSGPLCSAGDIPFATILQAQASGSSASAQTSTKITADGKQTINLSQPIVAGTQLCLEEDITGPPASTLYSVLQTVNDPNDFGIIRTYYTAGAVISNQTQSNSGTTAAQYIDIGIAFNWLTETRKDFVKSGGVYHPGVDSFISGRFSSIPVAAPVKNSTSNPSATTTATTLNVISSQESLRVRSGSLIPFMFTKSADGKAFFIAPIVKGGFETLLNPAATTTTNSSAATLPANFSHTYDDYSAGLRIGARQYAQAPQDEISVRTLAQMDFTLGRFSNLEELTCSPILTKTGATAAPTNTSCYSASTPTSVGALAAPSTTYNIYANNHASLPRIEAEGFIQIPKTPFVLGIDANLAQYEFGLPKQKLDQMNHAGSSVQIYFGLAGNLSDLFKNIKFGSSTGK
jgi:hypothetical protein